MGEPIRFLLNGEARAVEGPAPTTTILDYLRRTERLTGTKEGCAEGDCGACTVLLSEPDAKGGLKRRAVNACIQFLPSLNGRAVDTVEGIAGAGPVQDAMVERHASQCGFCTPGFVVQLHAGWLNGSLGTRQGVKDEIAGNLCRCTGYGPIVEAGLAAGAVPAPVPGPEEAELAKRLDAMRGGGLFRYESAEGTWLSPRDADTLADVYAQAPDARLVAGATDVGLWVTKLHRALPVLIDVSRVEDLRMIEEGPGSLFFGAAVRHSEALPRLAAIHPDLGEMMRRFAGPQIRNAGTLGGNVANGSPIGDLPPALIALGARLHLRRGETMRRLDVEDFFLDYGRQDRQPGEYLAAVEVPLLTETQRFFCRKISKRFDSDISAVMGAFRLLLADGVVTEARLAFGGMAGIPKRAPAAEAALVGRAFDAAAAGRAAAALAEDFAPLTDMRASAAYRLRVAGNLIRRFQMETAGAARRIEEAV